MTPRREAPMRGELTAAMVGRVPWRARGDLLMLASLWGVRLACGGADGWQGIAWRIALAMVAWAVAMGLLWIGRAALAADEGSEGT